MNKIIIGGVKYNAVEDDNTDCQNNCALRNICSTTGASPCLLYGAKIHFEIAKNLNKRTFKFRGKRVDNGKWIYGDLITSAETRCEVSDWDTTDFSIYEVNPDTVGQSTGCLDKNNIEIYEGDIVRCIDMGGKEYKSEVAYREGALTIMVNDCESDFTVINWAMHVNVQEILVIGNIHDNSELLYKKS